MKFYWEDDRTRNILEPDFELFRVSGFNFSLDDIKEILLKTFIHPEFKHRDVIEINHEGEQYVGVIHGRFFSKDSRRYTYEIIGIPFLKDKSNLEEDKLKRIHLTDLLAEQMQKSDIKYRDLQEQFDYTI